MLLDLRDGIRNSKWLKYIFVGLICVPFALFGIGSYFGNHGAGYAAKVNGQEVPVYAFQTAAQQSQLQIQQTFGGRLPAGIDLRSMVNNQAMDTVVRQEVLRQSTADNGFAVGDEDLALALFDLAAIDVALGERVAVFRGVDLAAGVVFLHRAAGLALLVGRRA